MKKIKSARKVVLIPISEINFLNPRVRNKNKFRSMAENISRVGLKKPITISRRQEPIDGKIYDLVCGQGRLEAYIKYGQTKVPAIIKETTEEDRLVMSLVENLARPQRRSLDLLQSLGLLQKQNYSVEEIAIKTGLSLEYARSILHLMEHGEERLVSAVESGQLPLSVALLIANTPDEKVQQALLDAYNEEDFKGKKFQFARNLALRRQYHGKASRSGGRKNKAIGGDEKLLTASNIKKIYKQQVSRKTIMLRKAVTVESEIYYIVFAMKELLADSHFVTLLRAEQMTSMPQRLADRVRSSGEAQA